MKHTWLLLILLLAFGCSPKLYTTDSGLEYTILQKSKDDTAITEGMEVETHCLLTLADGTQIWSTHETGETFKFTLGRTQMIKGFNEIIALMHVGEKVKVEIPSELGYGERGRGEIPPNADLIFEIEVLNAK